MRYYMEILYVWDLLIERREFVKMRGKETESVDFRSDVSAYRSQ